MHVMHIHLHEQFLNIYVPISGCGGVVILTLRWRYNARDGVSNHLRVDCLINLCSGADQIKHQNPEALAFVRGIHQWPVDSIWRRHHDNNSWETLIYLSWRHIQHVSVKDTKMPTFRLLTLSSKILLFRHKEQNKQNKWVKWKHFTANAIGTS